MFWEYLGTVVVLMVLWFGKCGGLLATRAGNVCRLNTVMSRSCFQIISLNVGGGGAESAGRGKEPERPEVDYLQIRDGYRGDRQQNVSSLLSF